MQTVNFSQLKLRHGSSGVQRSDRFNMLFSQFRTAHAFAFSVAILLYGITDIVSASTEKQVSRIDAPSVVAFMASTQTVRNVAISQHPCKPMGFNALVFPNDPKCAVSFLRIASPSPAWKIAGFIDFIPKPVNQRATHIVTLQCYKKVVNS